MSKQTFEALQPYMIVEDFELYNQKRREFMASSALGTFRDESAADYHYEYGENKDFDTASMAIGRGYHTLILEGAVQYQQRFSWDGPINNNTGRPFGWDSKAFQEFRGYQESIGKQVITGTQHNLAIDMRIALMKNKDVVKILNDGGVAERVIRADYCGVKCQVRPDLTTPTYGMIDLKSTKSLKWFKRDAEWTFGYYNNAAFYRSVSRVALTQAGHNFEDLPFLLIAQETKPPYKSAVYHLHRKLLDRYEMLNQRALLRFVECQKQNVWPSGYEGIEVIE